jgi:hypothetical protein
LGRYRPGSRGLWFGPKADRAGFVALCDTKAAYWNNYGVLLKETGSYQYSVKQGLATLHGTKTYTDSLMEENSYTIGFHITPTGSIAFDLAGWGQQAHWKYFDYDGTTGDTPYGGGNGTISLDEMGFVHSWQSRELDWEYDGSHYQGEAQTDKLTGGFHKHVYLNEYSYTGCEYSSESSANWSETSDWENELTKRHSFSDATWPILWTGRFTSYEQSGCGVGGGSMGTSFSGCGCGCGYGETSTSDRYEYTGCWSESYDPGLLGYLLEGGIDNHVTGSEIAPGYSDSYDETLNYIGFYQPTFTHPSTFDYVYPTRVGMLEGGLGDGCGCGCGLWGFETWVPIGAQQDTTSTSTIGRLPSGGLIAPAPLPAAWAFHGYLRSMRDVPESPHQVRAAGLSSFRTPNAIHGNGSPTSQAEIC